MTPRQIILLTLRVIMEIGIVGALAYWGYSVAHSQVNKIIFMILAPVVGFGIWGTIDFHQFKRSAELLRLTEELLISGVAALALLVSGQYVLGYILLILTVIYHALVYIFGERLLMKQ